MEKEKFKEYLKKSFSKGPKAKIILGTIVLAIILTITVVTMRKSVNVNIDGESQTYVTYKGTVDDVLKENGIELSDKDKIEPTVETKVREDDNIEIKKAVQVKVEVADTKLEIETAEKTVSDMLEVEQDYLKQNGIAYKAEDIVEPGKETEIVKDMNIKVTQVDVEEVVETQAMPYSSSEVVDYDKDVSFKQVTQVGIDGEKEVTYKVVKHNGQVVEKQEVSQKPVKPSQDEVITKGGSEFMASRGAEIKVQKKITVEATAYSGHSTTATGRTPVRASSEDGISTIAVDPRVIPLGSLVYVSGYGKAIAADTGGAIKGHIIDVYFNSKGECSRWGRKYGIEVGIISYPGEW